MTIRREIQAGQEVLAARTTRNTLTSEAKSNRTAGLIGTVVMGDAGLCVGVLSTFVSARNMILERDPEDFVRICAEQLTNRGARHLFLCILYANKLVSGS